MKKLLPLLLILGIIFLGVFSITVGSVKISFEDLYYINKAPEYIKIIVYELRFPRIIMAILVGMMLSSSGIVVQTVFKNSLADPYIIGISASATFGAVIAYILNLPEIMYGIFAFLMSLISTFIIFRLSRKGSLVNVTRLLVIGIAFSSFLSSFTSFAMYLIGEDSFKISMWIMGYLGNSTWKKIFLVLPPFIFSLGYFFLNRNNLDALLSGDEEAFSLGIEVNKFKIKMLSISALIVAFSVAFSGMIGFVGLIIPHILRLIVGSSNSKLIISGSLAGALFLLACDTFGRTILSPIEIPIGVVTSFFGAPFFLYLSFKNKEGRGYGSKN